MLFQSLSCLSVCLQLHQNVLQQRQVFNYFASLHFGVCVCVCVCVSIQRTGEVVLPNSFTYLIESLLTSFCLLVSSNVFELFTSIVLYQWSCALVSVSRAFPPSLAYRSLPLCFLWPLEEQNRATQTIITGILLRISFPRLCLGSNII